MIAGSGVDEPSQRAATGWNVVPSGPGTEGRIPYFKYRLHWVDGSDLGEVRPR
jgi:hypothetical protein